MNTLIIFVLVLITLSVWRRFHQQHSNLKFKYKLYALRDEVRELAYHNKIECDGWLFDYFDESLSKAISESYYITLFRIVMLDFEHKREPKLKEFKAKLEAEVSNSKEMLGIFQRYKDAIKDYVIDQHYVSIKFILLPIIRLTSATSKAAHYFNRWVKGVVIFPETSASERYTMA